MKIVKVGKEQMGYVEMDSSEYKALEVNLRQKCRNCSYWAGGEAETVSGCHALPPSGEGWPQTGEDDFCGKFSNYLRNKRYRFYAQQGERNAAARAEALRGVPSDRLGTLGD